MSFKEDDGFTLEEIQTLLLQEKIEDATTSFVISGENQAEFYEMCKKIFVFVRKHNEKADVKVKNIKDTIFFDWKAKTFETESLKEMTDVFGNFDEFECVPTTDGEIHFSICYTHFILRAPKYMY